MIDALAKIAKLKESHPNMGQRRTNIKGWKKFKKQVKRRSTINEPVQLAQSPANSPTSSPVTIHTHRSNSLGKKVAITVSQDKQAIDKLLSDPPEREPGKEKPVDWPLEDTSASQQDNIESSSSSLSVQQSGSLDHEEHPSVISFPPAQQQHVTNDNHQMSMQADNHDGIDIELSPQATDGITLQEALGTLKDTTCIYNNDFGNREHQEEIVRLFKMLEGDHLDLGPTDPSILEDLNGWRLAPKENM